MTVAGPHADLVAWLLTRGAPAALAGLRSLLQHLLAGLRSLLLAPSRSLRHQVGQAAQLAARALAALFQSPIWRLLQSQVLQLAWRLPGARQADTAEAGPSSSGSGSSSRTVAIRMFSHRWVCNLPSAQIRCCCSPLREPSSHELSANLSTRSLQHRLEFSMNWRPAAGEAGPRLDEAAAGSPPAAAAPSGPAAGGAGSAAKSSSSAFTSAMAEYSKLLEAAEGGSGCGKGPSPAAAPRGGRPSRIPAYKAGAGSPGASSGSAAAGEA